MTNKTPKDKHPRRRDKVPSPNVGFDKIEYSAKGVLADRQRPPRDIGLYRRRSFERIDDKASFYAVVDKYRGPDPRAPWIDIYSQRRPEIHPRVPDLRIVVRAPDGMLLRTEDILPVFALLECTFAVPLTLSLIEVAVDLSSTTFLWSEVTRSLDPPRMRRGVIREDKHWAEFGSRKSNRRVRVYEKREEDLWVTRVEVTLRRGALRCLGLNLARDIFTVSWVQSLVCLLRFRKLRQAKRRRKNREPNWLVDMDVDGIGVKRTLLKRPPATRRKIMRRLVEHPLQAVVRAALLEFEKSLLVTIEKG